MMKRLLSLLLVLCMLLSMTPMPALAAQDDTLTECAHGVIGTCEACQQAASEEAVIDAQAVLDAMIAALPSAEEVAALDEAGREAFHQEKLAPIYAFAKENGIDLDGNLILNAINEALSGGTEAIDEPQADDAAVEDPQGDAPVQDPQPEQEEPVQEPEAVEPVAEPEAPHTHNDLTFTAVTALPTASGSYCLTEDITLSASWSAPAGTTSICLNGHAIKLNGGNKLNVPAGTTLNIYDCGTTGYKFSAGSSKWTLDENGTETVTGGIITGGTAGAIAYAGTLSLYGGNIVGNSSTGNGGGIGATSASAVFNMHGGSVVGNKGGAHGGGIFTNGTVTLTGGRITNNVANTNGGGLRVNSKNNTVNFSGSIVIDNNYVGSTECNVHLENNETGNKRIVGAMGSGAYIGITVNNAAAANTYTLLAGSGYTLTEADAAVFHSDNSAFAVQLNSANNKLMLAAVPVNTFTITFNTDGGSEIAPMTVNEGAVATAPSNPTKEGYTFAGWKNGDADWDFSMAVTGDITLTAQWVEGDPAPLTIEGYTEITAAEGLVYGKYLFVTEFENGCYVLFPGQTGFGPDNVRTLTVTNGVGTLSGGTALAAAHNTLAPTGTADTYTVTAVSPSGAPYYLRVNREARVYQTAPGNVNISVNSDGRFSIYTDTYLFYYKNAARYDQWSEIVSDGTGTTHFRIFKLDGIDRTALNAAVAQAEAITGVEGNSANYTYATWTALTTALNAAKAISENATQQQIDAAATALAAAVTGLQDAIQVQTPPEGANVVEDWTDLVPASGTTQNQPYITAESQGNAAGSGTGTGGSDRFRIPAMVVKKNGSNQGRIVTAIDARWERGADIYIDTITSYSDDGGQTWHYSFPNYFGDAIDTPYQDRGTTFIDPVLVEGKDGTLYMMVDLFPAGVATWSGRTYAPAYSNGYEDVDGTQRMVLYTSADPADQTDSNYSYYVGDFAGGYATVYEAGSNADSGFYVDEYFYLYRKSAESRNPGDDKIFCQRLGDESTWIQQNLFFYNAVLHVRACTYLCLTKSTDGGATWSAPQILHDVHLDSEQAFIGGPGAGLCIDNGTAAGMILLPSYTFPTERSSFIWSADGGATWHRTANASTGSENCLVQIDANTVRQFHRSGSSNLEYTDYTYAGGVWTPGSTGVAAGVTKTTGNQLSAIRCSYTVDGKPVIMVSTADGGGNSRYYGKIYTFLLEADNSMTHINTYEVTASNQVYQYSTLAELPNGDMALLYESDVSNPGGSNWVNGITFVKIPKADLLPAPIKDQLRELAAECASLSQDAYTTATWKALQDALTAANSVLADESATAAAVETALTNLRNAKDALREKPLIPTPSTATVYLEASGTLTEGTYVLFGVADARIMYHGANAVKTDQLQGTAADDRISLNVSAVWTVENQTWKLVPNGDNFYIQSCSGTTNQYLTSTLSGKQLATSSTPEEFTITRQADGSWFIQSVSTGKFVGFGETGGGGGWEPLTGGYAIRLFKETEEAATMVADWRTLIPASGTTTGEPFPVGLSGCNDFRIPALITLKNNGAKNGRIVAAIDARWHNANDGYSPDGGGTDTILSYSDDNGATWNYLFPNYMGDSTNVHSGYGATFIDPILAEGKDGTIYLMADIVPGAVATAGFVYQPVASNGYENIAGAERMVLYTSPDVSDQTDSNYAYYIGDFAGGYAPVYDVFDNSVTDFYVDEYYYLYQKTGSTADPDNDKIYCQQIGSNKWVQQNVFFYNASLHVRCATFLYLVKSTDGGQTWSKPQIIANVHDDTDRALLVGPGGGISTTGGTVMLPCYIWNGTQASQKACFIWSNDGVNWTRSGYAKSSDSSENALVQINDSTVRMFYRDGSSTLYYVDYTFVSGNWTAGTPVNTGLAKRGGNGCQISAIRYSGTVDGKPVVIVSTPSNTGNRFDGALYTFVVNDDLTMTNIETFYVGAQEPFTDAKYAYSSLDELPSGDIALLYEATGDVAHFMVVPKAQVVPGADAPESGDHSHNDIAFTAWTDAAALPAEAGSYCLDTDVTLTAVWTAPAGVTNLCLDGHKIALGSKIKLNVPAGATLNIYDCGTAEHLFKVAATGNRKWTLVTEPEEGTVYETVTGGIITGGKNTLKTSDNQKLNLGGALEVYGNVNLYGGTIVGNYATQGGGVYVDATGEFHMYGGAIKGNYTVSQTGTYGGGGAFVSGGDFYLHEGEVTRNVGANNGGGFALDSSAKLHVSGGSITDNFTNALNGGGIFVRGSSTVEITGGEILRNTAREGAGIYMIDTTTVSISGGEISGNTATFPATSVRGGGGGIRLAGGNLKLSGNPVITGNLKSGEASNILSDKGSGEAVPYVIYLSGALTEDADIGINIGSTPAEGTTVTVAQGSGTYVPTANDLAKMTSDITGLPLRLAGAEVVVGNAAHPDHDNVTFTAWADAASLPASTGSYCLDADVTLTEAWTASAGVTNLCLNGHKITLGTGIKLNVPAGATLNLYDCGTTAYKFTQNSKGLWVLDENGTESVTGGIITGGDNAGSGTDTEGGAIKVTGNLNLYGGNIVGNYTCDGGGVFVGADGVFHMYGGSITGNVCYSNTKNIGGGVHVKGGAFYLHDGGTISYNTANSGGGVVVDGNDVTGSTFQMDGGAITNNNGTAKAGGVDVRYGATFAMTGGEISGNTSGFGGGAGVYITQAVANVSGGDITGNTTNYANGGGGVTLAANTSDPAVLNISGSANISGNYANKGDKVSNVYLPNGLAITMTGALSGDANVGVTTAKTPTAAATVVVADGDGTYAPTAADAERVSADVTGQEIRVENSQLVLGLPGVAPTYTITFNTDGGTAISPITLEAGDAITAPADPTKEGFVFGGWEPALPAVMPAENLTVTAIWTAVGHTHNEITFTETDSLPTVSGSYVLTGDVTVSEAWSVPANTVISLCLNGHKIDLAGTHIVIPASATLNLYDCDTTTAYRFNVSSDLWTLNESGTETINGGVITGGQTDYATGNGGAFQVQGTLNQYGGTIVGNKVTGWASSGGVFVAGNARFNMYGGAITGNKGAGAAAGGGVYVDGANSVFTMYGGTISYNYSPNWGGGGVYLDDTGSFIMHGGVITGNTAAGSNEGGGGAVYVKANATFTMDGGTITGNFANNPGDGVCVRGTFNISGSPVITGNGTGNLYLHSGKTMTLTGALTEGANIGVTTAATPAAGAPVAVAVGDGTYVPTDADAAFISSDVSDYNVSKANDQVVLGVPVYTITFDTDGGSAVETMSLAAGDTVTAPAAPTKAGFVFGGWNPALPATMPAENLTVTAIWNDIPAHPDHDGVSFTQIWTDGSRLPTAAGSYCLAVDVVLTNHWNVRADVSLCLNGHSIVLAAMDDSGETAHIRIQRDKTLSIYDCDTTTVHKFAKNSDKLWTMTSTGTYSLTGGVITGGRNTDTGNNTSGGGAIMVYSNATLNLYGGSIVGNQAARNGGGVNVAQDATFNMYGGAIVGNTTAAAAENEDVWVDGGGAGVSVDGGTFNLYGGEIRDNCANSAFNSAILDGRGGGVLVLNGNSNKNANFNMSGGKIYSNTGEGAGGGVYLDATTNADQVNFTMTGGKIYSNTGMTSAGKDGDGVHVSPGTHFKVSGAPIVSDNNSYDVFLPQGALVEVTGQLTAGCDLEISPYIDLGPITSGYEASGNGTAQLSYLHIDKECVYVKDGEVNIGHVYTFTAEGNVLTGACGHCDEELVYTVNVNDTFDGVKDSTLTYCGKSYTASVSGTGTARVITYSQKVDGQWVSIAAAPAAIGEYRAEIHNTTAPTEIAFVEFQIQAPVIIQKGSLTYTGSAQGIRVNLPTTSTVVGIRYSTNGGTSYGSNNSLPKVTDAGEHTIYFKMTPKSGDTTPYIGTFIVTVAPKVMQPGTPVIDYAAETITAADGSVVSATNTAEEGTAVLALGDLIGSQVTTVYVRSDGNTGNYTNSGWSAVSIPARPAAPSADLVTITNETVKGKGDGSIQIPAGLEYQDAEGVWQAGPAAAADLAAEDVVNVRTAATASSFASEAVAVSVEEGPGLTVRFDAKGGTPVSDVTDLFYNSNLTAPTSEKTAYTLAGWYLEETLENAWDFETHTVTADMTLYAKWTLNAPVIEEQPEGGETVYGDGFTLTVDAAEEEGLTYSYQWYRKGAAQDAPIEGATGSSYVVPADQTVGEYTYYCTVTVTDASGASNSTNTAPVQVTILKKDPTVTWPTPDAIATGSKLSEAALAEGFAWAEPDTVVAYGKHDYPVIFTPADTDNYNVIRQNVSLTGLDVTAPSGTISIADNKWTNLLEDITFGLLFKGKQEVEITAADTESGVDQIHYYLAQAEVSDFSGLTWTLYEGVFDISPERNYVIYAKLMDKAGNGAIINSNGLVLEVINPVLSGLENGKIYCGDVTVTVDPETLDSVTVDGQTVTPTDGRFTIQPSREDVTVVVTNTEGNTLTFVITVNEDHTFGSWTALKNDLTTGTCECGETLTLTVEATGIASGNSVGGLWQEAIQRLKDLRLVVTTSGVTDSKLTARKQSGESLKLFDISVYNMTDSTRITETDNVLQVPVPMNMSGKTIQRILRNHEGTITTMTRLSRKPTNAEDFEDGTWYYDSSAKVLYVCSDQYSTYGIYYKATTSPATGDNIFFWAWMMILSMAALPTVYCMGKKKYLR